MQNRDPNIVTSSYPRRVTRDGITVEVGILRLETEPGWSLEVVNAAGTSTVWDDLFETDDAANAAFEQAVSEEGMGIFLDTSNVVPFRR